jgi:hypothetical protein
MAADEQMESMIERHRLTMVDLARAELDKATDLIERFTSLAATKGIRLTSNSFSYVQTIGIVASAPGLAKTLVGLPPTERDGLFSYDEIAKRLPPRPFQAGYFVGSDYMLMAHPCYRRRMHSLANWAPRFVDLFWALDLPDVRKFIAIDEDRVRINVDGSSYLEADTWYGAPFDKDIAKVKDGPVKLKPPSGLAPHHIDFFFAQAYCLDIKWSQASEIKTFQAIELKTEDIQVVIDGSVYFPARYLHAEFDLSAGSFRHFDGAIQFFREDEYFRRRDSDFNITSKSLEHIKARSKKVFKLNGSIPTESWVELCCHFFAANPLTFEYFTGAYPEYITDILERIQSRSQ